MGTNLFSIDAMGSVIGIFEATVSFDLLINARLARPPVFPGLSGGPVAIDHLSSKGAYLIISKITQFISILRTAQQVTKIRYLDD